MGRIFELTCNGRAFEVRITTIDEGWELWLCENGRLLMLGDTITIDSATEAWSATVDPILVAVSSIREKLEKGELMVPAAISSSLPSPDMSSGDGSPRR